MDIYGAKFLSPCEVILTWDWCPPLELVLHLLVCWSEMWYVLLFPGSLYLLIWSFVFYLITVPYVCCDNENLVCLLMLQLLESLLPSRPKQPSPAEDAEEVDLTELDPRYHQKRREAYEDGSDDEAGHGPRVQCAHQWIKTLLAAILKSGILNLFLQAIWWGRGKLFKYSQIFVQDHFFWLIRETSMRLPTHSTKFWYTILSFSVLFSYKEKIKHMSHQMDLLSGH